MQSGCGCCHTQTWECNKLCRPFISQCFLSMHFFLTVIINYPRKGPDSHSAERHSREEISPVFINNLDAIIFITPASCYCYKLRLHCSLHLHICICVCACLFLCFLCMIVCLFSKPSNEYPGTNTT